MNPRKSGTVGNQLKSLVNPGNFMDQLLGKFPSERSYGPRRQEAPVAPRPETVVFSRQSRETDRKTEQETAFLLQELKKQITLLEKSEKTLSSEIKKVKVEQVKEKKGIYYLRFFEWLIGVVQQLRMKVEEGQTWLAAFNGRGKKQKGYWGKYKKHGTSFGLSNERTMATQSG